LLRAPGTEFSGGQHRDAASLRYNPL
jgi:hypothetical protein